MSAALPPNRTSSPKPKQQERLEALLESLVQATAKKTDRIPYSRLIPGIAREIILRHRPKRDLRSRTLARTLLQKLSRQMLLTSTELEKLLRLKSRGTDAHLRYGFRAESLKNELLDFAGLLARAASQIPKNQKGRSSYPEAEKLTVYLLKQYVILTGRAATRSVQDGRETGDFNKFVKGVFSILQINASPDVCVRKAIVGEKQKHSGEIKNITSI